MFNEDIAVSVQKCKYQRGDSLFRFLRGGGGGVGGGGGGVQNRNQYVTASLLLNLSRIPTLQLISHKFLVSGHSQMDSDSVHSTIEGAKKITPVYVPSQWCTIMSLTRISQPYITVPMKYNYITGFKDFVKKQCPNIKLSTSLEAINWLKVKWVQVKKESMKLVFVNYSLNEDGFKEIQVQQVKTRQSGRKYKWQENEREMKLFYES